MSSRPIPAESAPPLNLIHNIGNLQNNFNTTFVQSSATVVLPGQHQTYPVSLLLCGLPLLTVVDNCFVCLAVIRDYRLRTSTNLVLVSLAIADTLVGLIVMPCSIYLLHQGLHWNLSAVFCEIFIVGDVLASTASIVHLMAISIDRFWAVMFHHQYRTRSHSSWSAIYIIAAWFFSSIVALPLGLIMYRETPKHFIHNSTLSAPLKASSTIECAINNPHFMLYGSVFAFCIPCLIMFVMYGVIFTRLRNRLQAVKFKEMAAEQFFTFGHNVENMMSSAYGDADGLRRNTLNWALPFLIGKAGLGEDIENDQESISSDDLNELSNIFTEMKDMSYAMHKAEYGICSSPDDNSLNYNGIVSNAADGDSEFSAIHPAITIRYRNETGDSGRGDKLSDGGDSVEMLPRMSSMATQRRHKPVKGRLSSSSIRIAHKRRRQSMQIASSRLKELKARAIQLLMKLKSKQGKSIRKETKATELVVCVLAVFLVCWLPFFILNIIKAASFWTSALEWSWTLELIFIVSTWLGYLNSSLNPIIYSVFNSRFRSAFLQIIKCKHPLSRKQSRLHSRARVARCSDRLQLESVKSYREYHQGTSQEIRQAP